MKKGLRVLAIAESFHKECDKGVLVGIVQRGDMIIDGFNYNYTTIGGLDSTEKIIELYRGLSREDINYLFISGTIISWYNVIDLYKIYIETGIPVISITYHESDGLTRFIIRNFPIDWHERLLIYYMNGERVPVILKNGFKIYVRFHGLNISEVKRLLNLFTYEGKYPEPIRVARLIARRLSRIPCILQ